jgi:hypothetical protein
MPPFLVNGWRPMQGEVSPFRVTYGIHNPATRGLIVTTHHVIPNFSWTPRLVVEREQLEAMLACPPPNDLLVLPAVNTDVVRVFHDAGQWYLASNHQLEEVASTGFGRRPLLAMFNRCLKSHHSKRGLAGLVADLPPDRVWFFAMYDTRCSLLYLGSCALLSHDALSLDPRQEGPDLDFSLYRCLAPSIPILPELAEVREVLLAGPHYDADTLAYSGLYDGILLVNPVTLFAVRLGYPESRRQFAS